MSRLGAWFIRLSLLYSIAMYSQPAISCSSCGSGGADPVILNPSEYTKLYLGLGFQSAFSDIDHLGNQRQSYGADKRYTQTIAVAQRLHPKIFVSLVSGFGFNQKGPKQEVGLLDTSIGARATLLEQSFLEPWLPQIQLLFSHRFTTAKSIYNSKKEFYLDAFGSGFDETYTGVDIWFGMMPILFGGSYLHSFTRKANSESGDIKPGGLRRFILTAGFMPTSNAKLIGGVMIENRPQNKVDSELLANSERSSHDLFLTFETLDPGTDTFRINLLRKSAWGKNKNSAISNAITIAWMRPL